MLVHYYCLSSIDSGLGERTGEGKPCLHVTDLIFDKLTT
jgi:hypothetical protein